MNTRVAFLVVAVAALGGAAAITAGQNIGHSTRMSYEESSAIKRSMLPPGARMGDWQLDHCISLCLGGSNDRSNLQLQPWHTEDGRDATHKDEDEIRLCKAVSQGHMTRDQAVRELAAKWPCHSGQ